VEMAFVHDDYPLDHNGAPPQQLGYRGQPLQPDNFHDLSKRGRISDR